MTFNWHDAGRLLLRMDWLLVLSSATLCVLGVFFIFSAKYQGADLPVDNMYLKQMMWAMVGAVGFLVMALIDYRKLAEFSHIALIGAVVLLVLVFFFAPTNYAQRWIPLPGFNLQPSEIAKLTCLLALASFLSRPNIDVNRRNTILGAIAITAVPFVLILKQPDLGTSIIFLIMLASMLFVAGLSWRLILTFAIIGATVAVLAFFFMMEDYQRGRILSFLHPEADTQGTGWNAVQSKIAVASGGPTGKGFLEGTQNILGFLPNTVAPTDFIFSVIGEELGFVGSCLVIGLFMTLFFSVWRAAVTSRDLLGRLIAVGILAFLFLHVFVNIGMTVGVTPITGLPLPLVSYGGSFMISTMMALGLVQSIIIRRDKR